jgi:Flavodoxin
VIIMRALVVYESMYGNTHTIAERIADGLRASYEVTVVPTTEADGQLVAGADLLIVGGPTHMHGMSSKTSRRSARQAAAKDGSELHLDPHAGGQGLRDWLTALDRGARLAAAFDTRINGMPALTGRASRAISGLLKRHGYRLVAAPESFLVNKQNALLDGEAARARRWGMTVGAASATYHPAHA